MKVDLPFPVGVGSDEDSETGCFACGNDEMGLRNERFDDEEDVEFARLVVVHFKRCNWELLNVDIFILFIQ